MKVLLYTAYTVLVSDDITVNIYIDIDCKTVVVPLKALNIRVSKARSADRNPSLTRARKIRLSSFHTMISFRLVARIMSSSCQKFLDSPTHILNLIPLMTNLPRKRHCYCRSLFPRCPRTTLSIFHRGSSVFWLLFIKYHRFVTGKKKKGYKVIPLCG